MYIAPLFICDGGMTSKVYDDSLIRRNEMFLKFDELSSIESMPIPITKKPERNGDHANVFYKNMRNQDLVVSVTPEELEKIEFSQDLKYMKLPDFLVWVKSSKGPYLAHATGTPAAGNTEIKW